MRATTPCLLIVLAVANVATAGQPQRATIEPGAYEYPVRPGMPEWAQYDTGMKKVAATQVPEDILKRMSTAELAATCLNYPLALHVIAYNSVREGVENMIRFSNAHRELMSRKDVGTAMLSVYERAYYFDGSWPAFRKGEYHYALLAFERLFALEQVLEGMTSGERARLLTAAVDMYDFKFSNVRELGPNGLESSAFVMAKVLVKDVPSFARAYRSDTGVQSFLKSGQTPDLDSLHMVVEAAKRRDLELRRAVE